MSKAETVAAPKAIRQSATKPPKGLPTCAVQARDVGDSQQEPLFTDRHQLRSGAKRREKTRQQLMTAAVRVFAQKGPDHVVVDDFIAEAGVSRGSFYNHFLTPAELLSALMAQVNDEIIREMDPLLQHFSDPVDRVASGSRLYLEWASTSAVFASFMHRIGTDRGALGELVRRYLGRDLEAGRKLGMFEYDDLEAAVDLLMGASMQSIEAIHHGRGGLDRALATLRMALRGLGLPAREAFRVCQLPLPEMALPDSPILSQLMPKS